MLKQWWSILLLAHHSMISGSPKLEPVEVSSCEMKCSQICPAAGKNVHHAKDRRLVPNMYSATFCSTGLVSAKL